jgi:hypothetical protein
VHDESAESITKNLGLWNKMMGKLDESTDLNVDEITSKSDFYASRTSSFTQSQSLAQGKFSIFLMV